MSNTFKQEGALVGVGQLPDFTVTEASTALMIIDMQYLFAHRDYGMGAKGKELGNGSLTPDVENYFHRLETTVIPNIARLLERCRSADLPVVHVRIRPKATDGSDSAWRLKHLNSIAAFEDIESQFLPELSPQKGELVVDKTTSGVFNSTNVDSILKDLGIDTLIIVGVTTNGCVETSTRGAGDLGYRVLLVEDGCAATNKKWHDSAMVHLDRNFALVRSCNDVLAQIQPATVRPPIDTPTVGA